MLVINVSPLEFGHVLLVPNTSASLPQRLDVNAVRLSLDLILLSSHRFTNQLIIDLYEYR